MVILRQLLAVLFITLFFTVSAVAAAETAPSETAKEFYESHMEQARALREEAERQVRPGDIARKYRELADKAVEWELEGLKRYDYDSPEGADLPRIGGDAYYKSTAMREYARYLTQDYRTRIEQTDDPYQKFSLLQEWTNKSYDYIGEIWNATWDERVVDYRDVADKLSQAFGDELFAIDIGPTDVDFIIERRKGVARRLLNAIDEKMRQEKDPLWRAELLRDRLGKTSWVHKTAQVGVFDERVIPQLGSNGLDETSTLKEQGDTIIKDVKKLIDQESGIENKKELAEKLLDIVKWLKDLWKSAAFDERYKPDMSDWPEELDDLIDTSALPKASPSPAGGVTVPKQTTPRPTGKATVSQCDFAGYTACTGQFNLQGCIDACPFVAADCPAGTAPNTECKQLDQSCVDVCWDKGNLQGSQCAVQNHCTLQEIQDRLKAQ